MKKGRQMPRARQTPERCQGKAVGGEKGRGPVQDRDLWMEDTRESQKVQLTNGHSGFPRKDIRS